MDIYVEAARSSGDFDDDDADDATDVFVVDGDVIVVVKFVIIVVFGVVSFRHLVDVASSCFSEDLRWGRFSPDFCISALEVMNGGEEE